MQTQMMAGASTTFPVATGAHVQDQPVIAHSPVRHEALVVWVDESTSPPSLRSRRLAEDGTLLAAEFLVANQSVGIPHDLVISYSSASDSYLLAWAEPNGGISVEQYCAPAPGNCITYRLGEYNLYTLPLAGDGQPAAGAPTLLTDKMTYYDSVQRAFDLTYNTQTNEFLVAWTLPRGAVIAISSFSYLAYPHHIDAQRIGPGGQLVGASVTINPYAVSGISLGYSTASNKYMLLLGREQINDIYGQVLSAGLQTLGIVPLTDHTQQWMGKLAYRPADDSYLLTWYDGRPSSYPLRAKKIAAASGATLEPELSLLNMGGDSLAMYNASADQFLTLAESTGAVISVYQDSRARLLSQPSPAALNSREPGLAAIEDEIHPTWLAVWNSGADIYAQVMGPASVLPEGYVLNGPCPGDCKVSPAGGTFVPAGGPINTRTGGLYYEASDIGIPTAAEPLSFTRTYSSLATDLYSTTLGYGWTHNLDTQLIFPSDPGGLAGQVLFKAHSANRYQFVIEADGSYSPDAGVLGNLTCTGTAPVACSLVLPSHETYSFTDGRLQTWEDGKGNSWTYTYSSGQLTRVTDDTGGRYLSLGYAQGRIVSVSDSAGPGIAFGYGPSGDLETASALTGGTWHYEYIAHRLTRVIDPGGATVERTEYDPQGRAVRQYDGNGVLTVELTYNADGTTSVEDALGNVTSYAYNGRKALAGESAPMSAPVSKTFDPNFRPDTVSQGTARTTTLDWSDDGADLTYIKDAKGGVTNITYLDHNPHTVIDPRGFQTTYEYTGKLLDSMTYGFQVPITYNYTYTAEGYLATLADPLGRITKYEYDPQHPERRTKVIENYDSAHTLNEQDLYNLTTVYTYDGFGRLVTTTDPAGQVTKNEYDTAGRIVRTIANFNDYPTLPKNHQVGNDIYNILTEYSYDLHGNQIAEKDTYDVVTRRYYDANNRPVTVVQNLAGHSIEDPNPPYRGEGALDENVRADTVYDAAGNVIATIDAAGVITRTYYDAANRPVLVVQNLQGAAVPDLVPPAYNSQFPDVNIHTGTQYDDFGNAIATIDTTGRITRTYYDELNRPVTIVHNLTGQTVANLNVPVRSSDPLAQTNQRTDMTYDVNGNTIAVTDPLGVITRTYYDALNRPITVVQNLTAWAVTNQNAPPAGTGNQNIRTDTYYDQAGRAIATVDPLGRVTRTYYDGAGRPVTLVRNLYINGNANDVNLPAPARGDPLSEVNLRTDTAYDSAGRRAAVTDPLGRVTKYEYNPQGQVEKVTANYDAQACAGDPETHPDCNLVTQYSYDAAGRMLTTTDPIGRVTASEYDALGRLVSSTRNVLAPAACAGRSDCNVTLTYTYDQAGRQIAATDPLGMVTRTYYDSLGRAVSVVRNLSGQTVANPIPHLRGDDETNLRTDMVYDGLGRAVAAVDELGQTTVYGHDLLDRQSLATDPLGHTTHSVYDANGRLTSMIAPPGTGLPQENVTTRYAYDKLGRLTAVVENAQAQACSHQNSQNNVCTEYTYDASGNRLSIRDARDNVSTSEYDALGRLSKEHDALGNTWTYAYDQAGNRKSMLDANHQTTHYDYDKLNRLTRIDYPGSDPDVIFTYNAAGLRKSMTDGLGTTTWEYDDLDRPVSTGDPFDASVAYEYDALGNRTALTYPDDSVVSYQYDSAHRLQNVVRASSSVAQYSYNAAGRVTGIDRDNGVSTTYDYDPAGRLSGILHTAGIETLASYEYQYDAGRLRFCHVDQYGHPNSDRDCHTHRYPGGRSAKPRQPVHGQCAVGQGRAYSGGCASGSRHLDQYTHADTYADADRHRPNTDAYPYADQYRPHANCHPHAHGNRDTHQYSHGYRPNADRHAHPHPY